MEKFLSNTRRFIFRKQKDILSSAIILSFMIIISRVFGILRYRTLTHFFSTDELDIFIASFRLPDFLFEILITGALSSAFIPIFIKYQKNEEKLHINISSIINLLMSILIILVTVLFVGADFIVPLITPGFASQPQKILLITNLSRILLISQLPLLVLGNILSGIAQANRIFIVTAIAPILYNVGIILGTILFSSSMWIYGPILGVFLGSFLFFVIQIPTIFIVKFKFVLAMQKAVIREFVNLFLPRVLSVMTTQIDLTIDLILSTLLRPGSYTAFFFSQHLHLFPVSFFGMAFAQASLPYLSDLYKEKKMIEIKKIFVDSILQLFFLTIPLSLFFVFARTPIVRILFGGRKFDFAATNLTAQTLSYFAVSIPFHTIFYFLTRSFYAAHDTKTPFLVNFFSVFINIALSVYLVLFLRLPVWSLGFSFSISIIINAALLIIFYYKKIGGFNMFKLLKNSSKIYAASFISSLFSYPLMKLMDGLILDTTRTINVFTLLLTTFSFFTLMYFFLAWLLTIEEVYILGKLLVKVRELRRKVTEMYIDVG